MSFNPLYAQIELACAGAPVRTPEPENAVPGMPGRPVTSPANAGPALNPTMATTDTAAASLDFLSMAFSLLMVEPPRMPLRTIAGAGTYRQRWANQLDVRAGRRTTRRNTSPIRHTLSVPNCLFGAVKTESKGKGNKRLRVRVHDATDRSPASNRPTI